MAAAPRPVASGEPLVLLAAGGTGGHVFPAAALAGELLARGRAVALATDKRGESFQKQLGDRSAEVPVFRLPTVNPTGGLIAKVCAALILARALWAARRLIKRQRPSLTVGFGGHPSVPPLFAAAAAGLPTLLHEQNALLGRANRMLATRVSRIATSFESVKMLSPLLADRTVLVGNPVREPIARLARAPYTPPAPHETFRLLVIGGSQGAHVFASVAPEAVARLPKGQQERLAISQQCRVEDLDAARAAYANSAAKVELEPFFGDVPTRLRAAHLVITRAGASTVSELTASGRPAILAPYPHASDDHQMENARVLAQQGAAWLMPEHGSEADFTAESLAARLEALMCAPGDLANAARKAHGLGRPDAAAALADLVEALLPARKSAGA